MSEIDELANELGIDTEEEDTSKEVSVADMDTAEQIGNSDKLVTECKEIYKQGRENDLVWRWAIGQKVDQAYEDENRYEKGILKRLSEELDIAISDLSRFKKFFVSFDKDTLIDRAAVGYTWSHFKMVNDLPDGAIKKRMISMIEQEDEAPKTKDLQATISEEKNQQFSELDKEDDTTSGSNSEKSSSSKSYMRPVNSAMMAIEKLGDHLSDIVLQEESGMDFDTDAKEEKYKEAMDGLHGRLKEIEQIRQKIWNSNPVNDDSGELED